MTLYYKKLQDKRKESSTKGMWYGRAVHIETVDINDLADEMEQNCTVKRADILAVVSELVITMKRHLQASHSVKIDRLGTFKLGINTTPAESVEKFTTSENVKNIHVLFQPETKIGKNNTRSRALINGCKVAELPKSTTAGSNAPQQ